MKVFRAAWLFSILFALTAFGFAQTQITTGLIQGTVLDQTGAVMQGADVEAKNPSTNFSKSQKTDTGGRFVFLVMPPGQYTVTVTHPGFSTLVQKNLDLTVGQALYLSFSLKVSAAQEQIEVTSEAPLVETAATEASSTLGERTISNTPILGRKFEDYLTLTPGVTITQGPDGDEINFNGQRGIFNNVSLDGGDYNNGFFGEQMGGQRAAIDISLDAVREFQVVASGASAEFGRTASGVVNVVTKSGTNDIHGSLFEFQRLKALSSATSDGQPLNGFRREQFGGSIGGPIKKDKMFFFGNFEQILENLTRSNLSVPIGTPCALGHTPVIASGNTADESAINASPDCQRLALVNFMKVDRNQVENLPVQHPIRNSNVLGKFDWNLSDRNKLGVSYNFDYSKNENQTFDVPTYGDSANGTEGPSKIQAINGNLFTTLSPRVLNELHFTYGREVRPRIATTSNVPADTGVGFAPSFRFGQPFFLEPTVDETFWRTQVRDNLSIVHGGHNIKFGGEWIHSLNAQVFRGFFTGRYLFDSVDGFLRYASPTALGGFGPGTGECVNNATKAISWVTYPSQTCPAGTTLSGPLLAYIQDGVPTGLLSIPPGASSITNQDLALFIQDKWQLTRRLTVNYGLRWEAQIFPGTVVPPAQTAYGQYLSNPNFPSDGTEHNQTAEFQPRLGIAWDVRGNQKSVLRASAGIYYAHQNMLSEVGSITTNGVQQFGLGSSSFVLSSGGTPPTWPNPIPPPAVKGIQPQSGVRAFSKDYHNPRIYVGDFAYEQQLHSSLTGYIDFNWSKGVHLTDFVEAEGAPFFFRGRLQSAGQFPALGSLMLTESQTKSLYRGMTIGMRKRFSNHWSLDWNYVLSEDLDNDSNERDPFTDQRIFATVGGVKVPDTLAAYSFSNRDRRHKFNLYSYAELPHGFVLNNRLQGQSPQPIIPATSGSCSTLAIPTPGCRNSVWKNNEFISWDWRMARPFKFGDRYALTPTVEMFNTTNYRNLVNPLVGAALFDFSGFLRQGVGDPREVQLALRFTF